jgi:hypothetical protein
MEEQHPLHSLSDDELLRRLAELLRQSRWVEADLVAHIGEVDERRLYARKASASMFAYCTDVLRLSEAEAYLRIAAARAARQHPVLLAMLADGRLHLTGLARLAPHLTRENRDVVLSRAVHKSKRQIDELIAELSPRPDVLPTIRTLPERRQNAAPTLITQGGPSSGGHGGPEPGLGPDGVAASRARPERGATCPARPATVEPLAPGRYKVQFTASAELRVKLEKLQALMRTAVPNGDLATIIEDAVTEKLRRLEARHFACTAKPRGRWSSGTALETPAVSGVAPSIHRASASLTRHIPAVVRRTVYERDGGRCRYVDPQGRRCRARERLEFHHLHPYGYGGDHGTGNIQLMCHTHNALLAEIDYGTRHDRWRATKRQRADSACSDQVRSPA